jgi:hypothetical protein
VFILTLPSQSADESFANGVLFFDSIRPGGRLGETIPCGFSAAGRARRRRHDDCLRAPSSVRER